MARGTTSNSHRRSSQARFTVLVNQRTRDGFRLVKDAPVFALPKPPVVYGLRVLLKWGFIDAIIINQAFVPETDLLRPTLALDELRFLSELRYHGATGSLLEPPVPVIAELAPRSLRRLELHGIAGANLEPLVAHFARLTQLTLDLSLTPDQSDLITRQPMPHVRSLELRFDEKLLRWLETLPAVEELHFLHHHDASWLVRLAEGPLAPRLVTIGLPVISAADASALARVRHAFPKLRRLRGGAAMDLSNDAKYELGDLLAGW